MNTRWQSFDYRHTYLILFLTHTMTMWSMLLINLMVVLISSEILAIFNIVYYLPIYGMKGLWSLLLFYLYIKIIIYRFFFIYKTLKIFKSAAKTTIWENCINPYFTGNKGSFISSVKRFIVIFPSPYHTCHKIKHHPHPLWSKK